MNITLSYIPQYQTTTGTIVDGVTLQPIAGVKITDKLNNQTFTNLKGEFSFKIPILENGDLPKDFPLTINKKQYTIDSIVPYTSTGDVKITLGVIKLFTIEYSTSLEIAKENSITDNEINQYINQFKTFEFRFQEKIDGVKLNLKSKTIPLIYNLAAQYGVSQLNILVEKYKGELTQEAINELKELITCPSPQQIAILIGIKNKLVKQLNNSLSTIHIASNSLKINDDIVTGLDTAYNALKILPIPTAVAGVGIPISAINNVQDAKNALSILISKLKSTNSGVTSVITSLENTLTKVISYLNFLDKITQICSNDSVSTTQEQIQTKLTVLTKQQSNQTSPVVTNVNGFEMGVETEITENSLKRRRAIAKNKQNIIMLKGEWSFSSIDQILIDELVFYIQQNNLKAD